MNPLDQLRDIHLPETVAWWPIAVGWWLLAIIFLMILALLVWRYKQKKAHRHTVKLALKSLSDLESDSRLDSQQWLQTFSALLRQIAINLSGREDAAGLVGNQWLAYLDQHNKQQAFTKGAGKVLAVDPYRVDSSYDRAALMKLAKQWVKSSPAKGVKHA